MKGFFTVKATTIRVNLCLLESCEEVLWKTWEIQEGISCMSYLRRLGGGIL